MYIFTNKNYNFDFFLYFRNYVFNIKATKIEVFFGVLF